MRDPCLAATVAGAALQNDINPERVYDPKLR
jgi:hypothetical protein